MISAGRLTFIKAQNDKICCSIESPVVVALRLNSTKFKFSIFSKRSNYHCDRDRFIQIDKV